MGEHCTYRGTVAHSSRSSFQPHLMKKVFLPSMQYLTSLSTKLFLPIHDRFSLLRGFISVTFFETIKGERFVPRNERKNKQKKAPQQTGVQNNGD